MRTLRAGSASLLVAILAAAQPLSAAQLCPLTSPASGTTTVTASPNSYYPGTGTATAGTKTVNIGTLNGTTAIAAGDEVLIIQMQDSAINTSDTTTWTNGILTASNYGSGGTLVGRGVTSDNTTGEYEYATVSAVAAGSLTITGNGTGNGLINTYHTAAATTTKGQQTFQVVRVPRYNNVTLNITGAAALPWNGSSGGIFAIDASGTVTVTGTLSVDALGFRGGGRLNQKGATGAPDAPPFDVAVGGAIGYDGDKGEGSVGTPQITFDGTNVVQAATDTFPGGSAAMGAPGISGGGGTDGDGTVNDDNAGGGGGANGGDGGQGGNDWSPNEQGTTAEGNGTVDPANHIYASGGLGGVAFAQRALARVVLGGGGGAGTINNNSGTANISASGGVGGGMVLVRAGTVTGGSFSAAGGAGQNADNDAAGGGGAGGSIVITATGTISSTATAVGGVGGSTRQTTATLTEKHGPGGGGGGGTIITSNAITATVTGGTNGTTLSSNVPFGAKPGANGSTTATATVLTVPGVSSAAECIVDALTVTKTATANAAPGGPVDYTIVLSNAGPGRADGATVSDPLPTGITPVATNPTTCTVTGGAVCGTVTISTTTPRTLTTTVTTLPVGGSITITVSAVAPTTGITNPYTNTVTIAPPPTNTDANAKTASASTNVAQGNSGLAKTVRNVTTNEATGLTADTGKPGNQLEYTITFTNNTGIAISNFVVSDVIPTNTTYFSSACGALPTGITACNIAHPTVGATTGTVTWTYTGTLAAGASGTFTLDVKII